MQTLSEVLSAVHVHLGTEEVLQDGKGPGKEESCWPTCHSRVAIVFQGAIVHCTD